MGDEEVRAAGMLLSTRRQVQISFQVGVIPESEIYSDEARALCSWSEQHEHGMMCAECKRPQDYAGQAKVE